MRTPNCDLWFKNAMDEIFTTNPSPSLREEGPPAPTLYPDSRVGFSGPISGPMYKAVSQYKSDYEDTFDWGVYDNLYYKHASSVRAGVVYRGGLKVVNYHESCAKCHYAVVIDTYGRGCTHECKFCYAKSMLTRYGYWNAPHPFPLDLADLRKTFYTALETDKRSKWRSILEKRIPLRIGSMSDAFMPMERKFGITKELLKILSFYNYPYIVFTRGELVAADDYIEVMRPELASIQMSICGFEERLMKILEPGAPSIDARLKALKKLREAGIWATARIHPLFPTYPDGYFSDRQSLRERFGSSGIPKFTLCDIHTAGRFLERLKEHLVPSFLVGFAYLSDYAISELSKAASIDYRSFFKPEELRKRGDKRYSGEEIAVYYKKLYYESQRIGLRFQTCFIGNGLEDYYKYQDMWSNDVDCCDSFKNVTGFTSSSQEIPWKTRIAHAPCKDKAQVANNEDTFLETKYSKTHSVWSNRHSEETRYPV